MIFAMAGAANSFAGGRTQSFLESEGYKVTLVDGVNAAATGAQAAVMPREHLAPIIVAPQSIWDDK